MSKQLVRTATGPDPYGWRAGTVRVLASAALVLLPFEVVTLLAQPPAGPVVAPR